MSAGAGILSPQGRVLPIVTVLAVVVVLWYALAVALNYARVSEQLAGVNPDYSFSDLIKGTWSMERPVLPAPDQIAVDLWKSTAELKVTSKRSLSITPTSPPRRRWSASRSARCSASCWRQASSTCRRSTVR